MPTRRDMFQSAQVIADRGYFGRAVDTVKNELFQSAQVIADRGYDCRGFAP